MANSFDERVYKLIQAEEKNPGSGLIENIKQLFLDLVDEITEREPSVQELINQGNAVVFAVGTDNPIYTDTRNDLREEIKLKARELVK